MSYSPTIGRFLERDPIGYDDGMNPYEFVGSNPIGFVDPYGLEAAATQPTSQPTTQPIRDDNIDSDSAWSHYKGNSGTPLWMPFDKIDTASVKPSDFAKVRAEIARGKGDRSV